MIAHSVPFLDMRLTEIWAACCFPAWDGRGAERIQRPALDAAYALGKERLAQGMPVSVLPLPSGSILLEWGHYLEHGHDGCLTIGPSGAVVEESP